MSNWWQRNKHILLNHILVPFGVTRLVLVLIAWFSSFFVISPLHERPDVLERGWEYSQTRLLDVWARWDSEWYFDIIQNGYQIRGDIATTQNNIAFFPLYPQLVKWISIFFLIEPTNLEAILLVGVILSNVFLVGGLFFLYKIAVHLFDNYKIAQLAVWYLLLFPAGFYFSAFYTEATFLFFSTFALWAALKKKWMWAGIAGACLTASRSLGVLILIPLFIEYMRSKTWNPLKIRLPILWLGLVPSGILAFFGYIYYLTGDILAPIKVQQSWTRASSNPLKAITDPLIFKPYLSPLEMGLTVLTLVAIILSFTVLPLSLGLYALSLALIPLTTGSLVSIIRYYSVITPLFLALAFWGSKKNWLNQLITFLFFGLQIAFFIAWCQFYWMV